MINAPLYDARSKAAHEVAKIEYPAEVEYFTKNVQRYRTFSVQGGQQTDHYRQCFRGILTREVKRFPALGDTTGQGHKVFVFDWINKTVQNGRFEYWSANLLFAPTR